MGKSLRASFQLIDLSFDWSRETLFGEVRMGANTKLARHRLHFSASTKFTKPHNGHLMLLISRKTA